MTDDRRCTATAKSTGERCRGAAILGGTVCWKHGGAAPQVKQAAAERLKALQDPALSRLDDLLNGSTVVQLDTKNGPVMVKLITVQPSVVLGAAKTVLDRTGLAEGQKVELSGPEGGPVEVKHDDYTGLISEALAARKSGPGGREPDPE